MSALGWIAKLRERWPYGEPVAPSNLKLGEKTEDLLLAVEAPAVPVIDTSSAVGEGARRTASARSSNVRPGAASSTAHGTECRAVRCDGAVA